jgi:hypothetical protein
MPWPEGSNVIPSAARELLFVAPDQENRFLAFGSE